MDVLRRLSIAKKIYLIPLIGTLSFIIYLVLASNTALNNVNTLEQTRDVQFPVLQAAQSSLVLLEDAPHGCNVSHADAFNRALLEFLAR